MSHDIPAVISAMVQMAGRSPAEGRQRPQRPVITVSRDYGSGGDEIAAMLGRKLDVPVYDDTVLREVAVRMKDHPAIVRMLDEEFGRAKDMWLYRLLSGKDVGPDVYRDTLVKVILSLGRMGGVIVGRGAHVVLAESCALRLRVAGTPAICARRLAAHGDGDEKAALAKVEDVNHHRGHFVWEMFRSRLSDACQFDITVNTDRMADFTEIVEALAAMAVATHSGRVLTVTFGNA